jgi:DNA-binding NarL/FixJ family response regulator
VIRVLLVEGDQTERASLARDLEQVDGIEVVGQIGDGSVAPSAATALNPDVIVLSARLPVLPGPATAALLAETCPQVRVLGRGGRGDARALSEMRDAGAVGVIGRELHGGDLVAAILDAVTCA